MKKPLGATRRLKNLVRFLIGYGPALLRRVLSLGPIGVEVPTPKIPRRGEMQSGGGGPKSVAELARICLRKLRVKFLDPRRARRASPQSALSK